MAEIPIQQAYQAAGDATAAYSKGFSDMLSHLAQQDVSAQQALLTQTGAPAGQIQNIGQQGSFPGDVFYGQTGYIPASTFGREGAAWQAYASALPGIYAGQLAQQSAQQNQLAAAQANVRAAQAAASAKSAADGGMSEYQAASLDLRAQELDYQHTQDELDNEFKLAEFEFNQQKYGSDLQLRQQLFKITANEFGLKKGKQKADIAQTKREFRFKVKTANRDYNFATQKEATRAREAQARLDQSNKRLAQAQTRINQAKTKAARAEAQRHWNNIQKVRNDNRIERNRAFNRAQAGKKKPGSGKLS